MIEVIAPVEEHHIVHAVAFIGDVIPRIGQRQQLRSGLDREGQAAVREGAAEIVVVAALFARPIEAVAGRAQLPQIIHAHGNDRKSDRRPVSESADSRQWGILPVRNESG